MTVQEELRRFSALLVLILAIIDICGSSNYEDSTLAFDKPIKRYYGSSLPRFRRSQCDSGLGGEDHGMFGGGGGGGLLGGLGGLGRLGGLGMGMGLGGGMGGGMDPTFLLLSLLGSGGAPASPLPVSQLAHNPASTAEESRLVPLPASGPQKSPSIDPPDTKPVMDELQDELSYGLRPPPPTQPPTVDIKPAEPVEPKPRGQVTPGNRCVEDADCVAHAECVQSLMQKYCVCSPGRQPKGGECV